MYQVVILNPEQLVKRNGGFERLLHKKKFAERLISFIFDEAHCINIWASFQKDLGEMGLLCMIALCIDVPLIAASATLPTLVLNDIIDSLQLRITNLEIIRQPSTRPNIHLAVLPICSPLKTYQDLRFVLNGWKPGDEPPPKFLIFFDDIHDAVEACQSLWAHLPRAFRNKIKWFNSEMSNVFKVDELAALRQGDIWGLCTTDSFGMVCNTHVISAAKTENLSTGDGLTGYPGRCAVAGFM
jgi:superfamily II DNA helicase RecQ